MCRWIAYSGPPLLLSHLLTRPDHSLIDQSRRARENVVTTNGDGFGVGWYGQDRSPGSFRDTHPAWNNANLQQLANHILAPLFLAHVRAATGTAVQQTNCHPFTFETWLFQHNGYVPDFTKLKRQLLYDIDAELFPCIEGSTDSEILFFLLLTFGLRQHPRRAVQRTIRHVESLRQGAGIEQPFVMSAALADGKRMYAVRYSSDAASPTLYHSRHIQALHSVDGSYQALPEDSVVLVSEPLDELAEHWQEVPESSFVTVVEGRTVLEPLAVKPA